MTHQPSISAAYFGCAFHPAKMQRFIAAAKTLLIDHQFEAIAFRGMSGALVAPVLAYALNKSVIMVRKPKIMTQEHHSHLVVEGDRDAGRYLIVDDFRCTGETVRAILEEVHNFAPEARCMGAMFYHAFMSYGDRLKLEVTPEMRMIPGSSIYSLPEPELSSFSIEAANAVMDGKSFGFQIIKELPKNNALMVRECVDTPPDEESDEIPF